MSKKKVKPYIDVFVKTTTDEYELPIAIGDTGFELAKELGIKSSSVYTLTSQKLFGFRKVRIWNDE